MAVYNLGRCIPVVRGAYAANTDYYALDIVTNDGSSFIAKTWTKNVTPQVNGNSSHPWQLLALKGQDITQTQINEIISQVTSTMQQQGYVTDANYSAFKSDTQQAISDLEDEVDAIAAPGNGKLDCYVNGNKITTFFANQSGDSIFNVNAEAARDLSTEYFEQGSEEPSLLDNLLVDSPKSSTIYLLPQEVKLLSLTNSTIETGDWKAPIEYMRYKSTLLLVTFSQEVNNYPFSDVVHFTNYFVNEQTLNSTINYEYTYIFEINGPFVDVRTYKLTTNI